MLYLLIFLPFDKNIFISCELSHIYCAGNNALI